MGSKTKKRPAVSGGNGRGGHAVGATVPVPESVLDKVSPVLRHVNELQRQLGALEEDYEARRMGLLRALAENRQAYAEQVKQAGIELGLDLGPRSNESWMFDPAKKVFARQA